MSHNFAGKNVWNVIFSVVKASVVLVVPIIAGCVGTTQPSAGAMPRTATVSLPTPAPTAQPTQASTRVMPETVLTPPPTRTITPIPDEARALVVDVIDGDTISVVMDGDPASRAYVVRYIGIAAPLSTTPWGAVAYEKNRGLTNLKVVRLVRDTTDFDAEGNLLRYVYVGNQLLNVMLVEQGLAQSAIETPNTRFEAEILEAEERARETDLGLWGPEPPTPTATTGRPSAGSEEAVATEAVATPETDVTTTVQVTQTVTATGTATGTVESESTVEPTAEGTADATPAETPENE